MTYEIGNIKLRSNFKFSKIIALNYKIEANQHAVMYISALLQEYDEDFVKRNCFSNFLDLIAKDNLLFKGLVTQYSICKYNDIATINIICYSASILMDKDKKRRSFQNVNMQYSELFNILSQPYDAVFTFPAIFSETQIPYIQYDETDWEFAIRLSSRRNQCLVSNVLYDTPHIQVGYPVNITETYRLAQAYAVEKDSQTNQMKLHFKDVEPLAIGSAINYQGLIFTVTQICCELIGSELLFKFEATLKKDIYFKEMYNDRLKGAALKGRVLKTEKEVLRVHLDIDQFQDVKTAFDYQFAPDTVTQLYNMPEKNEQVILYIHSSDESDCSIKYTIFRRFVTSDPNVHNKSYINPFNKFADSTPNHMDMASNRDDMSNLRLDDDAGVKLSTRSNIVIKKCKNITLKAKRKVYLVSKAMINLETKDNSIIMEDDIWLNSDNPVLKSYKQGTYKMADNAMAEAEKQQEATKTANAMAVLLSPPAISSPRRAMVDPSLTLTLIACASKPMLSGKNLAVSDIRKIKLKQ